MTGNAAIVALLLGFLAVLPGQRGLSSGAVSPTFAYTVAKTYDPLAWIDAGERFSAGGAIFIHDDTGDHPLAPDFAASADPAVSFDGKRLLFAGRQTPQDRWQIWEMTFEQRHPRQITNCEQDCIRPFYLPDARIVYGEKVGGRFIVQSALLNSGKPLPLTYWPESSLPIDVLRDGRILLEAAFLAGSRRIPELYTVYSDGSGIESYRCDHGQARHSGKQVASGDIVFSAAGSLARFTSALASQVQIPAPSGEYIGDVAETARGDWLLPWRPDRNSPYRLMLWRPGGATLRTAQQTRGSNVVQPALVIERVVPKIHPSGLHDWPVGNLLCLNAYTSQYKFAAGSVESVRLYTKNSFGTQLLGTAPVEADGSFFVQVTGDEPVQVELLDRNGRTLKREAGWFWLRRGEQRACVGCHAGPETAPENAVPMVLLKSTTPADMTHAASGYSPGGK